MFSIVVGMRISMHTHRQTVSFIIIDIIMCTIISTIISVSVHDVMT